jgi:glutathione synthase/RimK-type ligase-like ATP-grasp enzyme
MKLGSDQDKTFVSSTIRNLNEFIKEVEAEVVVPTDTRTTRFAIKFGSEIAAEIFPLPNWQTFGRTNDKWRLARLLHRLQIPHPETALIRTPKDLDRLNFTLPLMSRP